MEELSNEERDMLSGVLDIEDEDEQLYLVQYHIDLDGGFGDAVETVKPVCLFRSENLANEYVKKHSKPEVYDRPYDELYRGKLSVVKVSLLNSTDIEPAELMRS